MASAVLAARGCLILRAIVVGYCLTPSGAAAQPRDTRADRQLTIDYILRGGGTAEGIARERGSCASGQQPASIAERRSLGVRGLPDAIDYCVTLLTRLGRDGRLGFVRDSRSDRLTAAVAFDNGFVTAYQRREPIPAELPSMATLRPIAQRCLTQAEPDTDLCSSAGYAYGVRAANGETVVAQ
ncbi:MAG: hypothetical protein QOD42_989 [Sphingomonadales bacterium]|jgi:hypothetical protein|nr:hypothetical protein [Sphingomonadales bacterium]